MKPLVWTPQALEDVEAIRAYVARDSEDYADLLVIRIVDSVERLKAFPQSGRVVPEFESSSLREVIHGSYRIVYRDHPDELQVLTVFHAARLLRLE